MMNTTPAQRTEETRSCRNHIAANVANTKLNPVSGQRKLMSLLAMRISRLAKNTASQNTPSSTFTIGGARFDHPDEFRNADLLHVADLRDAFLEQDHAGRFEDQPDNENQEQFGHVTNPGSESV